MRKLFNDITMSLVQDRDGTRFVEFSVPLTKDVTFGYLSTLLSRRNEYFGKSFTVKDFCRLYEMELAYIGIRK